MRMRIHNYYKEKPGVKHGEFYLKVIILGCVLAFMLIFGIKTFIWLVKLLIEYWIWAVGIIACAFLARHFIVKRRSLRR